ncbi:MAG: alcohol dehydrogenase catalytic domain-containing protein [Actinobacteria bacterium]|nr:alcohol dehydrogenase catalytic domain-containing protein [Actinomycetota bacterium]
MGDNEVKINVKKAGICGTDIIGRPGCILPVVIGHEFSGIITDVGPNVKNLRPGDKVTCDTTAYVCGKCKFCISGDINLCIERRSIASTANGAFAKYITIRQESVFKLPKNIDLTTASIIEPLACAIHFVIEKAKIEPNDIVVILGAGPMGLLCAQVAILEGAIVILGGKNINSERFKLAEQFGVKKIINVNYENISELVKEFTNGYGADIVMNCTGSSKAIPTGLDCTRRNGKFIQVGITHSMVQLDFDDIFYKKEISLIGGHGSKKSSWLRAIQYLKNGQIQLKPLITKELPLSDWQKGFEMMKNGSAIKVLLTP